MIQSLSVYILIIEYNSINDRYYVNIQKHGSIMD